ncbi:MAG: hypothetical protein WDO24_22460 [Pseudomonadota bacterium]
MIDDNGRGVFQGPRAGPAAGAEDRPRHQLSRALLLSRKAEMDGKPSSRSMPTTCAAATAPRSAAWTRSRCSI